MTSRRVPGAYVCYLLFFSKKKKQAQYTTPRDRSTAAANYRPHRSSSQLSNARARAPARQDLPSESIDPSAPSKCRDGCALFQRLSEKYTHQRVLRPQGSAQVTRRGVCRESSTQMQASAARPIFSIHVICTMLPPKQQSTLQLYMQADTMGGLWYLIPAINSVSRGVNRVTTPGCTHSDVLGTFPPPCYSTGIPLPSPPGLSEDPHRRPARGTYGVPAPRHVILGPAHTHMIHQPHHPPSSTCDGSSWDRPRVNIDDGTK
jgi:hypothetical protein